MPLADGAVVVSLAPTGLEARDVFREHRFIGGNVLLLRMLRDNVEELSLTASNTAFQDAKEVTEEFLANETAALSIDDEGYTDGTLTFNVLVENLAGHKFPTGFPARQAWLYVTVTDDNGEVVFESGAPQADGSIGGNDADTDPAEVEPHYGVITSADQVQIYESVMQNTDGEVTYVLLRGDAYRKDNRLLPPGFDPATAGEDFAVYGNAAEDEDFTGGSEVVAYEIDLPDAAAPLSVRVQLLFHSVSYSYAQAVIEEGEPLTTQFGQLYEEVNKSPTVVASADVSVLLSEGITARDRS
jgi:hypothetical protein